MSEKDRKDYIKGIREFKGDLLDTLAYDIGIPNNYSYRKALKEARIILNQLFLEA